MPSSSLRSALDDLASSFASAVLAAIRGASLEELVGVGGARANAGSAPRSATRSAPRRGPGRPRGSSTKAAPAATKGGGGQPDPLKAPKTTDGRLARRTPEEIAKTLVRIAALVKKSTGMRSEEIRKALQLDVREMPRVLKEGLAKKVLKSKGQKRATTYFAA
jgi:hypothetical protein